MKRLIAFLAFIASVVLIVQTTGFRNPPLAVTKDGSFLSIKENVGTEIAGESNQLSNFVADCPGEYLTSNCETMRGSPPVGSCEHMASFDNVAMVASGQTRFNYLYLRPKWLAESPPAGTISLNDKSYILMSRKSNHELYAGVWSRQTMALVQKE